MTGSNSDHPLLDATSLSLLNPVYTFREDLFLNKNLKLLKYILNNYY